MKKIGIITTTRADFDLLKPIFKKLESSSVLEPKLLVTGTHLSKEFGETYKQIENDGVEICSKIFLETKNSDEIELATSLANFQVQLIKDLKKHDLDSLLLLGDRIELMPIILSASLLNIPVSHLHGGELTEGAIDEQVRHSVTKFSHLHFTSTEEYRKRVIQLGECPSRVFNVGSVGVENINKLRSVPKMELEKNLGFSLDEELLLITLHSETHQDKNYQIEMVENLLRLLESKKEYNLLFTGSNMDLYSDLITERVEKFVSENENAFYFKSLGQVKYFSTLTYCSAVIGNTSSGVIEVPSFHIPTLNIGERQKGRVSSASVVNTSIELTSLRRGLDKVLSKGFLTECTEFENPYDKKDTVNKIVEVLETTSFNELLRKSFYNLK